MNQQDDTSYDALIDLLRVERDAIRSADFSSLVSIAERKQQLMAQLDDVPRNDMEAMRKMAKENQILLEAALKGVRAAQARLQSIFVAARGFNSYDRNGHSRQIRRDGGSLERRA